MRIVVLGHKGMLGHVCVRYFSEIGHEVVTVDKRYLNSYPDKFFDDVKTVEPEVIINCIGLIKQKSDDADRLLVMNAAFPLELSIRFSSKDTIIIHPSTDCIFSGKKGKYFVDSIPDPVDMYGVSKTLGETVLRYPLTWILRCSIIGPELVDNNGNNNKVGLLEWFLSKVEDKKNNGSNVDNTIYGFTNHKWNGITTLEWAKCASELLTDIKNGRRYSNIIQIGTKEVHSKAKILHMIADVWKTNKDTKIVDKESAESVDRSLVPMWVRKPLNEQLIELYDWYY